jgi:hypothetical protein
MHPTETAARPRRVDVPFADLLVRPDPNPPPIAWAVENFAAAGTLTILVAPTATGKTWLALQLAAAAATGSSVAGLAVARGRAMYVDAENGPAIIGQRLRDARLSSDFDYFDAGGRRSLDQADDRAELGAAIEHYGSSLVFLDSLRRLAPGAREDSSDAMAPLIGDLANIARRTGAAIVLQHHRSTKSGSSAVRGSSAIEDQADAVFALSRDSDPTLLHLTAGKFRLGPRPERRSFRFATDPPGFVATGQSAATRRDQVAASVSALADQVREGGHWTTGEIGAAIGLDLARDGDRRLLSRVLRQLVESGSWSVVGARGAYAPADA